ncbi:alpha/beta fold hydrolase [Roseomonas sp. HF4]|uniref:alpha/beta fold hydrolase n=1 Tax=Roseomonas sp. HF4 TaxID=2562313 RepID=UPI00197D104F|nr:alpha/beta hydrolase [Roseomonas sp. HF4]
MTIDGTPIAYAEAGSGKPLLMVHGTLGDQRSWAAQMAAFGAAHHAIAVSLRHCWPGEWTDGGDFTIARHTADVAGFITALGEGPVRLLGHSRGGHLPRGATSPGTDFRSGADGTRRRTRRHTRRHGDCQEFRVWPVMMGKKELPHGPTERVDHP